MRDFNFSKDETDISAADIAGVRPDIGMSPQISEPIQTTRLEEPLQEDASTSLNSFHRNIEEEEEASNNTAKIAGAVVVGLLVVGGGLYAYESLNANKTPVTAQLASQQPAPKTVAMAQPASAAAPAPDTTAASTPAPAATPAPARAAPIIKQARNTASPKDEAVNAPMTLTPQTAPPPEQSGSSQTAMAQPQQPAATTPLPAAPQPDPNALANNAASGVTLPSDNAAPANVPAPSNTVPDTSTTPAPADSSTTPSQPAPASNPAQ